jgi:hypothetical protein
MRFFITIAGEVDDIPRLYTVVLKLVDVICSHAGFTISAVEVEEQEAQYNPYCYNWISSTTKTTGADNT